MENQNIIDVDTYKEEIGATKFANHSSSCFLKEVMPLETKCFYGENEEEKCNFLQISELSSINKDLKMHFMILNLNTELMM